MRNAAAIGSLLAGALFCGACEGSPTEPVPLLTVSATELSLVRTETRALTATTTVKGAGTDVTSAATWRSSNTQVATAVAGLVTAVGPGTATISAEHSGQTRSLTVTVRRRTSLSGELRVETLDGSSTVEFLALYLDGVEVGGTGTSSPAQRLNVRFVSDRQRTAAEPGGREVRVRLESRNNRALNQAEFSYVMRWLTPVTVVDRDTSESLTTLELAERTITVGPSAEIVWNVTIPAFSQ